jgi:hypothetical protein
MGNTFGPKGFSIDSSLRVTSPNYSRQ